jgi:uncharacterized linocin/CFP29 family protein
MNPLEVFEGLKRALLKLTCRGYSGPFVLTGSPELYDKLYTPVEGYGTVVLLVDVLSRLFRGGVYMAPVIRRQASEDKRVGAIITVGRAYARLVVGQDWYTAYRGRDGVQHRFLLMSSLQLRVCETASIEVLTFDPEEAKKECEARGTAEPSKVYV